MPGPLKPYQAFCRRLDRMKILLRQNGWNMAVMAAEQENDGYIKVPVILV